MDPSTPPVGRRRPGEGTLRIGLRSDARASVDGHQSRTVGRPDWTQPVIPPHTLTRSVNPCPRSRLATRLERTPPAQVIAIRRSRGSSPSRAAHLAHRDVTGALHVAIGPFDRLAHVEDQQITLLGESLGQRGRSDLGQGADRQTRGPNRVRAGEVAGDVVETHAGERGHRPGDVGAGLDQEDERRASRDEPGHSLRELGPVDPRVEAPGHVAGSEGARIAAVDEDGARREAVAEILGLDADGCGTVRHQDPPVLLDDAVARRWQRRTRGMPALITWPPCPRAGCCRPP